MKFCFRGGKSEMALSKMYKSQLMRKKRIERHTVGAKMTDNIY